MSTSSHAGLRLAGISALALIAASAVPAFAQSANQPAAGEPVADAPQKSEEIVVTGTYLGNIRQEDRASPVLATILGYVATLGDPLLGGVLLSCHTPSATSLSH